MANIGDYLDMAELACSKSVTTGYSAGGLDVREIERATAWGNGLGAIVFENRREFVVAFSATRGGVFTAPISQNTANARIGLNVIPNMAGSAYRRVFNLPRDGRFVSVVGHSLGGGLAQIVGAWAGVPFISFNGPGMKNHLKMAGYNVFKPRQMLRTRRNPATDPVGLCFNVKSDFVAGYGTPLGTPIPVARSMSGADAHSIEGLRNGLGGRLDWNPSRFDPAFGGPD